MKSTEDEDVLARVGSLPPEIVGSGVKDDVGDKLATTQSRASGREPISKRRLGIIVFGLCLSIFLTALDQVPRTPPLCQGKANVVDNCVNCCADNCGGS